MDHPEPTPEMPPEGIGRLLGRTLSALDRRTEAALRAQAIDLPQIQVRTLRRLAVVGPISASELARSLPYDTGGMTRVLDQLEQQGLLQRQPDPADRRALRIVLTRRGQALGKRIVYISEQVLNASLADLSAGERAGLAHSLQHMLTTLCPPAVPGQK